MLPVLPVALAGLAHGWEHENRPQHEPEQVKRNRERFPSELLFPITLNEKTEVIKFANASRKFPTIEARILINEN